MHAMVERGVARLAGRAGQQTHLTPSLTARDQPNHSPRLQYQHALRAPVSRERETTAALPHPPVFRRSPVLVDGLSIGTTQQVSTSTPAANPIGPERESRLTRVLALHVGRHIPRNLATPVSRQLPERNCDSDDGLPRGTLAPGTIPLCPDSPCHVDRPASRYPMSHARTSVRRPRPPPEAGRHGGRGQRPAASVVVLVRGTSGASTSPPRLLARKLRPVVARVHGRCRRKDSRGALAGRRARNQERDRGVR